MVDKSNQITWSWITSAVPNSLNHKAKIILWSNRKIYSSNDALILRANITNNGKSLTAILHTVVLFNKEYIGDLFEPDLVFIDTGLSLNIDLMNYSWSGIEPKGDYTIVTLLYEPDSNKLIYINVCDFEYLGEVKGRLNLQ